MNRKGSFPWAVVAAVGVAVALLAGGGITMMLSTDSGSRGRLTLSKSPGTRGVSAASTDTANASPTPDSSEGAGGGGAPAGAAAPIAVGAGASPAAPTMAGGRQGATPTSTKPSGSAKPTSGPTGPAGPTAAAPGTYRYRQGASLPGTPSEGTLVVAPVSASGTQLWTRRVGGTVPASASVMLFNTTGSYLVSPGSQLGGAPAGCTFAAPVPWPPWPTTPGLTFAAHATCSGPVSTYQVAGRVQGTASVSLDGHAVDTSIVVNTFVLKGSYAGSPLTITLTETDYYAPNLRVPVVARTHVVGSALGLPVSTDRTDTLISATPS